MRICLIGPVPPYRGGIARYCHLLARELEERHDLLLLSYRRQYPELLYGRKSQLDPDLDFSCISHEFRTLSYDLDSVNPLSWLAALRRIVAFKADLVILPWWVAYWAPLYLFLLSRLSAAGIRTVLICINIHEHEDSRLKRFLADQVLKRSRCMVVHSGQEQLLACQINPGAGVRMHPLPLFSSAPPSRRVHEGQYRLLFFGFVRPYKGLDLLIEALGILNRDDVSLTVAGEFWEGKETLEGRVRELGLSERVTVIDRYLPDEEMQRCFEAADLVVLPYRRSVTSGVIATAYGFGRPVLATRVGGFHEVVQDGYTGRLVPPGDPKALAAGISWFMERRQTDFAGNIRRFTGETMSWRSLADLLEGFA